MKVFCVIPAWNEASTIFQVVDQVKHQVDEVVVVDDGSIDDTVRLANSAGAIVLSHQINRGQGAALRTGTQYALDQGADIIVHFDADGQFVAEEIPEAVAVIANNEVEAVFGSRLARLFNLIFLGVKFNDPQNGFRVLSASAARQLDWQQDKMAHCSEILWLTKLRKIKYQEIGVTVRYHNFGQNMSGGWRIITDLLLGRFLK